MIALLAGVAFWFGSVPLAVALWRLPAGTWVKWPARVSAIPLILLVEWLMLRLFSRAMNDDGDGPPGMGFMYAPGLLVTLAVVFTLVLLLVAAGARTLWITLKTRYLA